MVSSLILNLKWTLHLIITASLWNYNPDNDDTNGDYWNGENFSWFSRSRARTPVLSSSPDDPFLAQTRSDLDDGGRILRSVVRPYAAKTAGIPLRLDYEINTGKFEYEWVVPTSDDEQQSSSPLTSYTTEIFIPALLAADPSCKLRVTGFSSSEYVHDEAHQTLSVTPKNNAPGTRHMIVVEFDPPLERVFELNDLWGDFGGKLGIAGVVVLAVALLLV